MENILTNINSILLEGDVLTGPIITDYDYYPQVCMFILKSIKHITIDDVIVQKTVQIETIVATKYLIHLCKERIKPGLLIRCIGSLQQKSNGKLYIKCDHVEFMKGAN